MPMTAPLRVARGRVWARLLAHSSKARTRNGQKFGQLWAARRAQHWLSNPFVHTRHSVEVFAQLANKGWFRAGILRKSWSSFGPKARAELNPRFS